jgi:hypothetical protein
MPEGTTASFFDNYDQTRKRSALLRASTALSQRAEFHPDQAARRAYVADRYRNETGVEFDPRYTGADTTTAMEDRLDVIALQKIAEQSEPAADFLGGPGNMELAYDDLGNVGFAAGFFNSMGFGADATADTVLTTNRLGTLAELERNIQNQDKTFGEVYAERQAAESALPEGDRVGRPDQFLQSLNVYVNAQLGSMLRLTDDMTPTEIEAERSEILRTISEQSEDREEMFPRSGGFKDVSRRMAALPEAETAAQGLQNVWDIASADPLAFFSFGLQMAAESVPGIAVAAATRGATGSGLLASATMGLGSAQRASGSAFEELVADGGYDIATADGRAALLSDPRTLQLYSNQADTYGLVVGIVDAVSGGMASATLSKSRAGDFLLQMLTQSVMGSSGEALGRFAAGMPIDWTEVVLEGIIELVTAPLEIAGVGGKAAINRATEANSANQRRQFFNQLSTSASESKLRTRAPRKYQELIARITKDGPVEDIYVNPDDLTEMFQTDGATTAEEFFSALPDTTVEAYEDAKLTGMDIKIPTAVYAAHIVGTKFEGPLGPHIRFGALEMSMAEATNLQKEIKESAENMAQSVDKARKLVAELSEPAQVQYEVLVSQLQTAGRSPEVASREALPMARFLDVRAARSGVPVSELADKYSLPSVVSRTMRAVPRTTDERISMMRMFDAITTETGSATDQRNAAVIRRELQERGVEATPETVRAAILEAASRGDLVGELDDELLMAPSDIYAPDGDQFMQTVSLRDGSEDLAEWGLDVPSKTRELAIKLQKRQRAKYGKINRKQRGPKTVQKMANWMADEAIFEMQTPDKSAKGWYGEKFQQALDIMARIFPELKDQSVLDRRNSPLPGVATVADARSLMTMILAITSNGQKVRDNYRLANTIFKQFRVDGDMKSAMPKAIRGGDMALKLGRMQALAEEFGGYDNARKQLLEEITVADMNKQRRAAGLAPASGMPAAMIVPRSAVEFGPKLGAFFANLSGSDGFLTMDLWWTRTINRYRGDVLPKVSGLKGSETDTKGNPIGLHRFKLMIDRPDLTDSQALNYATEYANRYKDKGFKNGTEAEKAANTLYKAAFVQLDEQPAGAADRAFMLEVAQATRAEVERRTGERLSIADVQAILWYYEKRLYAEMGVRDSGDISYEDAARLEVERELSAPNTVELMQVDPPKDQRADVVAGRELAGDGRKFAQFFADVTAGVRQQASNLADYVPVITLPAAVKSFAERRGRFSGNFEDHIQTSIPGYREMQDAVGYAISRVIGTGSILDLGASEGAMVKQVVSDSPGATAVALDPNVSMQASFEAKPAVPGVEYSLTAFGSAEEAGTLAWTEDDGTAINIFDPEGQTYDVVHEAMVFQFISNKRGAQIARVKELLTPGGLFITAEKLGGPSDVYAANEAKKDAFKSLYFDADTLAAKRAEVLQTGGDEIEGMTDLQVSSAELEAILSDQFAHVVQIWDSGNFKGYAASDDPAKLAQFSEALPPLTSEFANVELPRQVVTAEADATNALEVDTFGGSKVADISAFAAFPNLAFEADNWFIVSPNTDLLDRPDEMRARLDALGHQHVELRGVYLGDPDGTTFLVVGPRWQGRMLAEEFGQESYLTRDGLIYSDGSGRKSVPFDGVLRGADAKAAQNHSIRVADGEAFSLNLQWPVTVDPTDGYFGIPLEADGTLKMTHWSDGQYETLDPAMAGTGPLRGEERKRRQVPGVFFGLAIGRPGGYTRENLGPYRHETFVDPTGFYPFYADPQNLRATLADDLPGPQRVGAYEELIKAAGFKGYVANAGPVGMVAKSFEPVAIDPGSVRQENTFYQNGPQPTFKSVLAESISSAKQEAASPGEWLAIIGKMPGVKKTEREFSGVDAYLEAARDENPKQRINRQQLYQWVAANTLDIEVDASGGQFGSYVEDGETTNYRTVLLTVPNLDLIGPNAGVSVRPFVNAGHFSTPNIVVHARVTERGDTFFVEEVQSDLNSEWRKSDVAMPTARTGQPDLERRQVQLREELAAARLQEAEIEADIAAWQSSVSDAMTTPEYQAMRDTLMSKVEELRVAARGTSNAAFWETAKSIMARNLRNSTRLSELTLAAGGVRAMNTNIPYDLNRGVYEYARTQLLSALNSLSQYGDTGLDEHDILGLLTPLFTVVNEAPKDTTLAGIVDAGPMQDARRQARTELADRMFALGRELGGGPVLPAPITPFADASAIELAMKQLMRMAAEGGFKNIAWTPGYMQGERWQVPEGEDVQGFINVYDRQIKKFVEKFAKKNGGRVELGDIGIPPKGDKAEEAEQRTISGLLDDLALELPLIRRSNGHPISPSSISVRLGELYRSVLNSDDAKHDRFNPLDVFTAVRPSPSSYDTPGTATSNMPVLANIFTTNEALAGAVALLRARMVDNRLVPESAVSGLVSDATQQGARLAGQLHTAVVAATSVTARRLAENADAFTDIAANLAAGVVGQATTDALRDNLELQRAALQRDADAALALAANLARPDAAAVLFNQSFLRNMFLALNPLQLSSLRDGGLSPEEQAAMTRPVWKVEISDQMRTEAQNPWALFQRSSRDPNASIILPPPGTSGQAQINLFEGANLSTVLHEGAHYYLWVLQSMALEGETSAKAEMDVLRSWWFDNAAAVAADAGVDESVVQTFLADGTTGNPDLDAKVNVGLHEQFARGFELYTMEGKSPSNVLRAAFESFAAWMMERYKSARGLNVGINNDVRAVFDRLLATDAELAEARIEHNMESEIADVAKEMGLDPDSYRRLVELTLEAKDEAKQMALKDVMEPIYRERRDDIKRERAALTEQITEEVMSKKGHRVVEWLANGRWVGGDTPEEVARVADMRLDSSMLRDEYPDVDLTALPRGKRPLYARDTLVQADEVAELFGYRSGDEMLKDLATMPSAKAEIKGRVDAAIREKYGDALTDGTLAQTVVDALHGEKRGQVIVAELRAINRISSRTGKMTTRQQAAAIAREAIARMSVRDATRSQTFLGAERRYAERATRALAAGDTDAAFEAKRKQLLNHALYIESRKAMELRAKTERLSGRLLKRGTRKNLAGEYLAAIDSVLETYDFRRSTGRDDQRRENLRNYIDMMIAAGREGELAIPAHVRSQAERAPYMTLSMQRLQGVYDTLKNIEHTARLKQKLKDAKAEREMSDIVSGLEASFDANVKGKPRDRVPTGFSKVVDATRNYVNTVMNADTILRRIDGWEIGSAVEALKRPIDEAAVRAQGMREQAADDFVALYSVFTRKQRSQMAVRRKYDAHDDSFSRWDLISMALNAGNKDNYERLTSIDSKGRFTADQVDALLGELTEAEWRYVQSVWDYIGSYWSQIEARERRTTGVTPKKVEAGMQVEAPGFVRGGYYPIKYDSNFSAKTNEEQTNDLFANMQAGRFGKAQTRDGHLTERQGGGGGRTLELGMHVMHGHVQQVIHDLAFSEPVNASWRILREGRVQQLFEKNNMLDDLRSLEVWLQDTATGQLAAGDTVSRMARRAKAGFTISKLAFNMSTVAVQLTGLAQTTALIGPKAMAVGVGKLLAGGVYPVGQRIKERSAFMAERETTFNRDLYDLLSETTSGPLTSAAQVTQDMIVKAGFMAMQKIQYYAVDLPTWLGAYEKAVASGKTDADAAYEADRMVARAQSSGLFSDRSAIERGTLSPNQRQSDFVRLFTALGSYMFAKLNVSTEIVGRTDLKSPVSVLKMLTDLALLFTVEAVAYAAIKGTLPGMGEDDDDDQDWATFLASQTALSYLSTLPFLRDLAGPLQGFGGGGSYGGVLETLGKPVVGVSELASEGKWTNSDTRGVLDALALAVPGIPSTAINRIIKTEEARRSGAEVSLVNYIMGLPR